MVFNTDSWQNYRGAIAHRLRPVSSNTITEDIRQIVLRNFGFPENELTRKMLPRMFLEAPAAPQNDP